MLLNVQLFNVWVPKGEKEKNEVWLEERVLALKDSKGRGLRRWKGVKKPRAPNPFSAVLRPEAAINYESIDNQYLENKVLFCLPWLYELWQATPGTQAQLPAAEV